MAEKITGRLQTPVDSSGNRKDIHLITTSDEVIVNPDSPDSMTLTEKLAQLEPPIVIKSSKPGFPCIWADTSVNPANLVN